MGLTRHAAVPGSYEGLSPQMLTSRRWSDEIVLAVVEHVLIRLSSLAHVCVLPKALIMVEILKVIRQRDTGESDLRSPRTREACMSFASVGILWSSLGNMLLLLA